MRLKRCWQMSMDTQLSTVSMDPAGNFVVCAAVDGTVKLFSKQNQMIWEGNISQQPP
jgi:hypothetical protein